jgi:hypothetical protein
MTDADFALFVRQSSCAPQSGERVAWYFHRWRRRLLALGIITVRRLTDGPGSADEESARLHLTLLMLQAASLEISRSSTHCVISPVYALRSRKPEHTRYAPI